MFCGLCRRKEIESEDDEEVGDKQFSSPQRRVIVQEDNTVSALPEAPKKKAKEASWRRLFHRKKKTKQQTAVKEDVSEATNLPSSATEKTVNTTEEPAAEADVQEALAIPDTPLPAAAEGEVKNTDVAEIPELPSSATEKSVNTTEEPGEEAVQEDVPAPDTPVPAAAEDEDLAASSSETIVNTTEESEGEADVQEASAIADTSVSAAAENEVKVQDEAESPELPSSATENSVNTTEEPGEEAVQEDVPAPDTPVPATAEDEDLAASSSETIVNTTEESEGEADVQEASAIADTSVPSAAENEVKVQDEAESPELPSSATENSVNTTEEPGEEAVQEDVPAPDTPVPAAAEDEDLAASSSETIVNTTEESEGEADVPEASAIADTSVSAEAENEMKVQDEAESPELPSSATENSVNTTEESEGEADVQEASAIADTSVPAAAENEVKVQDEAESPELPSSATENSVNTTEEPGEEAVQEDVPAPDTPVPAAAEDEHLAASSSETIVNTTEESEGEADVPEASAIADTSVSAAAENEVKVQDEAESPELPSSATENSVSTTKEPEEASPTHDTGKTTAGKKKVKAHHWLIFWQKKQKVQCPTSPRVYGGRLKVKPIIDDLSTNVGRKIRNIIKGKLPKDELVALGFPNLARTCYMNSILQGLLTITDFIQDICNQESVWSSLPNSELLRGFVKIKLSRCTRSKAVKKQALTAFKRTVAEFNSEFEDDRQKDAHEFLSCVLNQLRCVSADLQAEAFKKGCSYTCPVDANITFQMLSTRTCNGCGMQSTRKEDYINLSLDLVPGGTVSQCLQDYLKENQLEYQCECGAETSSQQGSFLTLPNALIIQLKRFNYTECLDLEIKINSHITLSRQLVLNTESSASEQTPSCYSLMSIVSHLGSSAHFGHYICDGAHGDEKPQDMSDNWLTYNDKDVRETTSTFVCHLRQQTAYLLFYMKHQ
ncbi:ubiquitin carboxyl-terminal hydrolase 37-like [Etheostoma cragini]|uniref:ubiquitin carboxyl-terminal hydrolase 37-like n=1 Tax=Etheostoma cragini TaxID=417921 RepID=UPI00155EBE62|nr:ubiquitin carboxyl-terminal hydrolase 37-like [Etheostoma cragini]